MKNEKIFVMSKEELIPALIFYWVIFSIGYRFLGFNFALHFSGFGKEEFKKNISTSSKSHWYASLVIGLIISFIEILFSIQMDGQMVVFQVQKLKLL